jgi:hypothetical protein
VDHKHVIIAIEEISATVSQASGQIQTNTIFEYDKEIGRMVAKGRPSDELLRSLTYAGVEANSSWFQS